MWVLTEIRLDCARCVCVCDTVLNLCLTQLMRNARRRKEHDRLTDACVPVYDVRAHKRGVRGDIGEDPTVALRPSMLHHHRVEGPLHGLSLIHI
eukprot:3046556-Alexandrium_andersonii.AAC.1